MTHTGQPIAPGWRNGVPVPDETFGTDWQTVIEWGENHVTYSEVLTRSRSIGACLKHLKIEPGSIIGACIESDPVNLIAAVYGILDAECCFVLFNSEKAEAYFNFLDGYVEPTVVFIDNPSLQDVFNHTVLVDEQFFRNRPLRTDRVAPKAGSPAFLYIGTGPGGKQGAVTGTVGILDHYTRFLTDLTGAQPGHRLAVPDQSGLERFIQDAVAAIHTRTTLCIPVNCGSAGETIVEWIHSRHIRILFLEAGGLKEIVSGRPDAGLFPALELVVSREDCIKTPDVRVWFDFFQQAGKTIRLVNLFSVTGLGLPDLVHTVTAEDACRPSIPAGTPIAPAEVYVLDQELDECDDDWVGDVYLYNPYLPPDNFIFTQEAEERFISDPFVDGEVDFLFRTGRKGKWLGTGEIEILPLPDRQEKPPVTSDRSKSVAVPPAIRVKREDFRSVEPAEKMEYYPLSSAQKRLYVLQEMDTGSVAYNMPSWFPIDFEPDRELLETVFKQLIRRHENFRTSIIVVNGRPVQRITDDVPFRLQYHQYDDEAAIDRSDFIKPFDMESAPLLRAGIIELPGKKYFGWMDMHHIISDGTSVSILTGDFFKLFQRKPLPPLRLQYKDFSQWQHRMAAEGRLRSQEQYWLNVFADAPELPRLELPADFSRPPVFTFEGGAYRFQISGDEVAAIRRMTARHGATLYMFIMAILNVLYYKYTGQTDIIIGSGIMGRPHADLEQIIGMFVNMLPIRCQPEPGKTFSRFLDDVVGICLQAFENQDMQFEELVDRLEINRDASRNPLFDVSMVVQNFYDFSRVESSGGTGTPGFKKLSTTSKFDVTFFVAESSTEIAFSIEYYSGIFNRETIERMAAHFLHLIRLISEQPSLQLDEIDLVTVPEREKILDSFSRGPVESVPAVTLNRLVEEQITRFPDVVALVYGHHEVTYGHLDRLANRLARYLVEDRGIQPGQPVVLLLSEPLLRAEAILGVLKSGAAYVPLDPELPGDRLRVMVNDTAVSTVISEVKYLKTLNQLHWECPAFDTFLCLDTFDINGEVEQEESQLMNRGLWRHVAETAVDDITGGGWLNSYTGQPFSRQEMDEYGDNILKKVEPLLHSDLRVLEIGCASGISMFRIAPLVGQYTGTDLSEAIIEVNRKRVRSEGRRNIRLFHMAAHEIGRLKGHTFDLIIINSVIQCFPGHNYLRRVLRQCTELLSDRGVIFAGDIMDHGKKRDLEEDLLAFKRAHRDENFKTKTDISEELFVARGFWDDFAMELPYDCGVEFSEKIYTVANELTRFRYDVQLHMKKIPGESGDTECRVSKKRVDRIALAAYGDSPFARPVPGDSLAYMIYTSGSTGRPKGVQVEHGGVVNTLVSRRRLYGMNRVHTAVQLFSYGFDGFVTAFFTPLVSGSRLVLLSSADIGDTMKIGRVMNRCGVTHLLCVPPLFSAILKTVPLSDWKTVQTVTLAGDRLDSQTVEKAALRLPHLEIANEYGLTETSVMSTIYRHQEKDPVIKIGQPISNTALYIISSSIQLQPIGVAGEIFIAGIGVAKGYLNHPELTAELFLTTNKISSGTKTTKTYRQSQECLNKSFWESETRGAGPLKKRVLAAGGNLFKTGDSGRWLRDGNIEFLGRIDTQVKIRGFRVEVGEIEKRLVEYPGVREAAVVARGIGESGDAVLCAYVVSDGVVDSGAVKEFLGRMLPGYMVPSYVVEMDVMPVGRTGKINRGALPEPGLTGAGDYRAPGNDIEEKLVDLWASVLGIDRGKQAIGIDDNFFNLGGHSLKATILVSSIHKEMSVRVPLARVFEFQTIRELGAFISDLEGGDRYAGIMPVEKREYYPLSSAQKRMFFLQQMEPETTGYNMPMVVPVNDDISASRMERAFQQLIERHESLRTSFVMIGDAPVQRVHETVEFRVREVFYTGESREELQRRLIRPFDLSQAPLMRAAVIRDSGPEAIWVVDMHHIISDGTSHMILTRDFSMLLHGRELEPLKLHYKDFSRWQNRLMASGGLKGQEEYWLDMFNDAPALPVLDLPLDAPRPDVFSFEGSGYRFVLGARETEALRILGRETGATLYMMVLSFLNVLFYKYTGQTDIIIGSGIAGRPHADLQPIIGMFINMLAMRNRPEGDKTFDEFLHEVMKRSIDGFENQDVPFEELVDRLEIDRDASRNPVFDIAMVVQNFGKVQGETAGAGERETAEGETGSSVLNVTSKFDITFSVSEARDRVAFNLEFYSAVYRLETIERMAGHLRRIIEILTADPWKRLDEIELISADQKKRIVEEFNRQQAGIPLDRTVHELFLDQVLKAPDRGALACKDRYLTYGETGTRAFQVADYLKKVMGLQSNEPVVVSMEPGINRPVAVFGVLLAGGAFVPVDTDLPQERLDYIVRDTAARVVITDDLFNEVHRYCTLITVTAEDGQTQGLPLESATVAHNHRSESAVRLLRTRKHLKSFHSQSPEAMSPEDASDLAYILYTSGTTGHPKGVGIEHSSLVNLCYWHNDYYGVTSNDRASQFAGFGFDASVWELFPYLLCGASVYLVPDDARLEPELINRYFHRHYITIAFLPTQMCELFMELENTSLRLLLTGGDKLKKFTPRSYKLYNNYGPTENTVVSTAGLVEGYSYNIPIGKPITNCHVMIADYDHRFMQPIGVPGEVCIAGIGLARGYLNRPELTARLFLTATSNTTPTISSCGGPGGDSFKKNHLAAGSIFYKTGDSARWLFDGNIEFLGRIDTQVKIRGFRIEVGEIEVRLSEYPGVREAVVEARVVGDNGDKALYAYIVSGGSDVDDLKRFLADRLPGYMVPSFIIEMDELPLTASGKINRRALPLPGKGGGDGNEVLHGELERRLAMVWADILNIETESIGAGSNFFDLGGHSLNATVMSARVHKEFNVKLPVAEIFKRPTLRRLALYISGVLVGEGGDRFAHIRAVEKKEYYPLSPAQARLYFIQQLAPEGTGYNMPQVIPLGRGMDVELLNRIFKKVIERHESFRTSFQMVGGEPVQRIHDAVPFGVETSIYDDIKDELSGDNLSRLLMPFDLSEAPLVRAVLAETTPGDYTLLVDMHHIIGDGVSNEILHKEIPAILAGEELPALKLQYRDYSEWLNSRFRESGENEQEDFWLNVFPPDGGPVPVLELPYDFARPPVQSSEGRRVYFVLGSFVTRSLRELARREEASLFMVSMAVFQVLLARLGGADDIVVGTPVAARRHADLQNIIGMFVNTLPVRGTPEPAKTFMEFLYDIKEASVNAFDNQEYPFEDMVEKFNIRRDMGRNPVFDVMLTLRTRGESGEPVTGGEPGSVEMIHSTGFGISKFDITLNIVDAGSAIHCEWEYCSRLFKPATSERFARYFCRLIEAVTADPYQETGSIDIITEEEKNQILYRFNDTDVELPGEKSIHQWIEKTAEQYPDAVAAVHLDTSITYRELSNRSGDLAVYLQQNGIRPGKIVALKFKRTLDYFLGILGTLKAGAAFLPIDPTLPRDRIDYMLNDSNGFLIDELPCTTANRTDRLLVNTDGSSLAYIIYTSGSTGRPKGVMIEHRSLVNAVNWQVQFYKITTRDHGSQYASIGFDASILEIFPYFTAGAVLHVVPDDYRLDLDRLNLFFHCRDITVAFLPTQICEQFTALENKSLRVLYTGGDRLRTFIPGSYLLANNYGPTENTVIASACFADDPMARVTIGTPVHNIRIYIINTVVPAFQLQPIGIAGEIFLAGAGVARGYLNRPEQTADTFLNIDGFNIHSSAIPCTLTVSNNDSNRQKRIPSDESVGTRHSASLGCFYRTGDIGRWLENGSIEFVGRADRQVKVRGFRVELEEIERLLVLHEAVETAAVVDWDTGTGERYLCGYVAFKGEGREIEELKRYLETKVPGYMVPAYFQVLDELPLSTSGKIDRRRLPPPERAGNVERGEIVPPETGLEKKIADIWRDVLGVENVGIHENFFDIGGTSISIVKVHHRIKEVAGKDIPLVNLFRYPTVQRLAEFLENDGEEQEQVITDDEIDERRDTLEQTFQLLAGDIDDDDDWDE